jgi:hypothetical protein
VRIDFLYSKLIFLSVMQTLFQTPAGISTNASLIPSLGFKKNTSMSFKPQ